MRTTSIIICSDIKFEIFVAKREEGFELWMVGPIKGRRMILDHLLTHDDLEALLEYSEPADLIWHDAEHSEIPAKKHQMAIEYEAAFERGIHQDFEYPCVGVITHLNAMHLFCMDRSERKRAEKMLLGRWTDTVVTMDFMPNKKAQWSCADRRHPLNAFLLWQDNYMEYSRRRTDQIPKHLPNWWNLEEVGLFLRNIEHKLARYIDVIRVDEQELHLQSFHPNRLARIFRRVQEYEGTYVTPETPPPKT